MRGKHLSSTRLLFLPLQRRNAPLVSVALSSSWPVNAASAHQARGLANIRDDNICFVGSSVQPAPPIQTVQDSQEPPHLPGKKPGDGRPPDKRTLNLGKTVRVLHERLPLLLTTPLPQDILSPSISLHLFPSTHPHLPNVSGRISYTAALWTSPVAWGRVPVVGNVRLKILSERMIGHGVWNPASALDGAARGFSGSGYRNEKLIVRWQTCRSSRVSDDAGAAARPSAVDKISEFLGRDVRDDKEEFTGLFIFEFDDQGRIGRHTIEHAQSGGNTEKMVRVVSVTDWLLGLAKGRRGNEVEGLALGYQKVPVEDEAVGIERARRLRDLGNR